MGNTVDYDVKSYQVKMTIVKCTKVQKKDWGLTAHRKICWYDQRACDTIKQT